jgi:hypothetical protein
MVSDEVLLECDASPHRFLISAVTPKRRGEAYALPKLARKDMTVLGNSNCNERK